MQGKIVSITPFGPKIFFKALIICIQYCPLVTLDRYIQPVNT